MEQVKISPDGNSFEEFAKGGISTRFVITEKEECRVYRFSMENPRFTGEWEGRFFSMENGGTKIVFTERIKVKNPVMRFLARFFMPVRKMQETYIRDLKRKLMEE